ncbi:MAG: HAD family hydrolase [Longimicrobiales bacterium]
MAARASETPAPMAPIGDVDAVTFDFYDTLAHHASGQGRGALLMEYFRVEGITCDAWEHKVLYDVFEPHATEYSPDHSEEQKQQYYGVLAERLFRRLNVRNAEGGVAKHAVTLWRLLGPASLSIFPEVPDVVARLRAAGYPLAVVSNWQCGLRNFCVELGIAGDFDHVIASAEVGYAKPAPEIFHEACRRLGTVPQRVLHVGDSITDDIDGGRAAGLQTLLVRRDHANGEHAGPAVASLAEVPKLLGLQAGP